MYQKNQFSVVTLALVACLEASQAIAKNSLAIGPVHGHQIEVQGSPVIAGRPYPLEALSVTEVPTVTDVDSTDSHAGWRYVWQVDGVDQGTQLDVGMSSSNILPFIPSENVIGKQIRVCVSALASSGYPTSTMVSEQTCSNEISILAQTAPEARNVTISGTLESGHTLTGRYDYFDAEGDEESGTTFQWFRVDDAAGTTNKILVGSGRSYTLTNADRAKYMAFEVAPKSSSNYAHTGSTVARVSNLVMLGMIGNFSAPDGIERNWSDANNYCINLIQHGADDWRLPSRNELVTLYNMAPNNEIHSMHGWPGNRFYWSSTLWNPTTYTIVALGTGGVGGYSPDRTYYVTCVR